MTESGGESAKLQKSFPYEDIVNLPHHRSETHPHMSMEERAAQFSSFAALTGHKEAVQEKARRTGRRMELDEDQKARLDEKLQELCRGEEGRETEFTVFYPDDKTSGGSYEKVRGVLKRIDAYEKVIWLEDGKSLKISDIIDIQ